MVLDRTLRLLSPIERRLENLRSRVTSLANRLNSEANRLARTEPPVNGLCIFDRETNSSGTVQAEYVACLEASADDSVEPWDQIQQGFAKRVISNWKNLPEAVVPPPGLTPSADWLTRDCNLVTAAELIPVRDLETLESAATEPFNMLSQVDVLERWQGRENARQEARSAAAEARPFLPVDTGTSATWRNIRSRHPPFDSSTRQSVSAAVCSIGTSRLPESSRFSLVPGT